LWSILTYEVAIKRSTEEKRSGTGTSIELGDIDSENIAINDSHSFPAMVSKFWSGTMRTDTCDFTREGITVGSRWVGRLSAFIRKAWEGE
jgi:hypothetical protein